MQKRIFFLTLVLVLSSCSFKKTALENQTLKGHVELYSKPDAPALLKLDEHEKRFVIAATNDLRGNLNPESITFTDSHNEKPQTIRIGGKDIISNYFQILREVYKDVVLVDSGDIFSDASHFKDVQKFYKQEKYDAITVGLRDFNLKVPSAIGSNTQLFQRFAKTSKVPLLLSNLHGLKTGRVVEWEGTKSHIIKDLKGVKVGIIGLVPDDIAKLTPVNNRIGFFVEDMLQATLRHSRLLRSLGANLIVVITHQGIDCGTQLAAQDKLPLEKVNFEPERESVCNLQSPLGQYLERLPPQLIDVVVGGRINQKTANFVNGTLVINGFQDGKSFSFAEFVVNTKTKSIVPQKTVVHQPVMFCNVFFNETKDCFYEDSSINHEKKIPATFLGQPINSDLTEESTGVKSAFIPNKDSISKAIELFNADLSYFPKNSGETQLFVVSMSGKELAHILEEDYNRNSKLDWWPSPFILEKDELTLSISGLDFDLKKNYRILTDLESLQKHRRLITHVNNLTAEALMNYSWSSLIEDSISSTMAAPSR